MANQDDEQGGEHEETEDEASSDEETREEEERDEEDARDEEDSDDGAEDERSDEVPVVASASDEEGEEGDEAPSAPAPIAQTRGKAKPKKMTAGARVAAAKAAKAAQKAVKKQTYAEERAAQTNAPAPSPDEEEDPVEQIRESPLGQATVRAQEWVSGNQGLVVGALAVAAIALLGWFGYRAMNDSTAVAAGALLEEAVEISRAEIRDEGEEADDEDGRSYASVAERNEAALAAYRRVLADASGTSAAGWARLGEGRLLLESGEPGDARQAFEAAIASHGADPIIAMRAYEGVGFTYEAEENWDEARESFERIRGLQNGEYAAVADYNIARVRLATGDDVGAQTALEELVDGLREDAASGEPAFPYVLAQAQTLLRELDPSSASGASAPTLGAGASEEEIMEMIRRAMESRGGAAPGE